MKTIKPIIIIQGGNYGSEAKGAIADYLSDARQVDYSVRTGSINAGHTVYYKGKSYKMQMVPVGWVNLKTKLVIGAGAYVHPGILDREVGWIAEATGEGIEGVKKRLFIDFRAGLHTDAHHAIETGSKLHERMGSTGEGVAEAIIDKMHRTFEYKRFGESEYAKGYQIADTVCMLHDGYDAGEQILLEGTQGTMLDLHLGHYPYVTSRQVSAAAWATEAGLSPSMQYETVLVVRTYPIRVAGNSGPFVDETCFENVTRVVNEKRKAAGMEPIVKEEAIQEYENKLAEVVKEWELPSTTPHFWSAEQRKENAEKLSGLHKEVFKRLTPEVMAEISKFFEFTTVTRKLRRIANLNPNELAYAAMINRPDAIAVTFFNYVFPETEKFTKWEDFKKAPNWPKYQNYLKFIQETTKAPVKWLNVEPVEMIEVNVHDLHVCNPGCQFE